MNVKVVVERYAVVDTGYDVYRVFEDCSIDCWDEEFGWVGYFGGCYESIQDIGLKALEEHKR